jgi:polar amino acid transport system substrate-binding protein
MAESRSQRYWSIDLKKNIWSSFDKIGKINFNSGVMSIFSLSKIGKIIFAITIILNLLWIPLNIFAQEPNPLVATKSNQSKKVKVATKIASPLVMDKDGTLEGFSIDLWKEISKRNNFETEFSLKTNVKEMLDSITNLENDAAISAISQTADREKIIDFSQPYLRAGLEILVRANESTIMEQVINFLQSGAMKFIYFGLLVIFILAHLHYLYRILRNVHIQQNYFLNIWDSVWWLFNGFFRTEFGDQKQRIHQMVSTVMIIISIITQFQAMVTADLTLDKIDSKITSLDDIKNKKTGVVKSTTAEKFAIDSKLDFKSIENNDKLFEGLVNKESDAIILDAPIAKYYATNEGKGKVTESISLNKEQYAIAFPIGSDLRKQVNEAILNIEQDGTMAILNRKWFGQD